MNFRLTAALFGTVFVIGVILLILSYNDPKKVATDVLAQELALANLKTANVDSIEFERPGSDPLLIVRTDADRGTWQIQKPITANAEASKVLQVITALLSAKPTQYAEIRGNPAAHGLDPAGLKVTVRSGDKSSTISLGDVTLGDKGVVFVTTSSQSKRPMAVRRGDLDALFREPKDGTAGALAKWTSDYRTPAIFPSDTRAAGEDVTSVKLELPNKKKELALSRVLGVWKFDSPAGWGDADVEGAEAGTPGTFSGVRRLLGALTSVSAATPGDFIDSPKDLKEYGLNADNPDLVKVELKTREGSAVVYFGKREAAALPAMPPGMPPQMPTAKVYVRVEGQPGVIRASAGDLSGLNGVVLDPSPLRDRTLVTADRAKADGIDIVLAGQPADKPTKLRFAGTSSMPGSPQVPRQWALYGGPGDPQPADDETAQKILDVVFARRSIKDFPAANPANFAAVSATVLVWADGFNPPAGPKAEPVKKIEPIKLEFGRKDGDTVYVRRTLPGLPPTEFTISAQAKVGAAGQNADAVATVAKSRLDLLDQSLPTFSSETAARLAVSGASNYTLDKDEKPDPFTKVAVWRYVAPEPKGRGADTKTVEQMLQLLGTTQSVTRFVDEQPAEAKLAEYGFTPAPRLKVVVGLRPGSLDKERVYEFGKDTADPNFVYARVTGKVAVFTLPRLVFDKFVNPDLRDKYILRGLDPGAMSKVTLKGWGDAGVVAELVFEKNKDGVWGATKPAGFALDPAKVNAFLNLIIAQPVKGFESGGPDLKHGFHDPKQSLEVVLHWPGGVVSLNLGASPDGGATYYGSYAWAPQVFTLEGAPFKPFKTSTGGFAK